jgi:hypothetical protein
MKYTIHLITFANKEPFIQSQKILDKTYSKCGISTHTMWNRDQISNTDFYKKNQIIFEKYRTIGFGLYMWKPYIIYEKIKTIEEGEFIYYQDSSRYDFTGLEKDIMPVCEYMDKNNIELIPGAKLNKQNRYLIKGECLNYMGCNDENFLNCNHYQTSPMLFKKTANTINFIKEWLDYCQIPQCIVKNTETHQCDQAILNILLYKYGYEGLIYIEDKNESKKYSVYWKLLLEYIENKI